MAFNIKVTAFFVGLGIIGTSAFIKPTYAEESKTLKEWGVPSVKGLDPSSREEWVDCSDKLPGEETKLEWYFVRGDSVRLDLLSFPARGSTDAGH